MENTSLERITFTQDQENLIRSQIAPKATPDELKLFLYQCKRTGLDPLTRQMYCIHRNSKDPKTGQWVEKMTIQTSIDGFRVIAERSGDYGGQEEPEFIYSGDKLICCKVPVFRFRGDVRYKASVGVAYWDEYVPTDRDGKPMGLWVKMKHTMLSKVAEALGLRKAYPQDLSGLYTAEEMQQADANVTSPPAQQTQPLVLPEKTQEELHDDFMGLLAMLIALKGDDAMKYHPDAWRKEKNIMNYNLAIEAIKKEISKAEMVQ